MRERSVNNWLVMQMSNTTTNH